MSVRALLIVNPASGRGRARSRIGELRRLAMASSVPLVLSHDADDVARRCRDAVEHGIERVVVAGGDGTLHHAIRGLHGSSCALGIVPVGSGNDLARALGLPKNVAAALRVALRGPTRRIDLGFVGDVPFASVASIGIDSAANRLANESVRWLRGVPLYLSAALRTLLSFEPVELRVEGDSDRFEGRAVLAVVANTGWYGGGMRVTPDARVDDGVLDVLVVAEVDRLTIVRWLPSFVRGRHVEHPKVRTFRSRAVRISAEPPSDVYCDGERVDEAGANAVEMRVRPASLLVACPPVSTSESG